MSLSLGLSSHKIDKRKKKNMYLIHLPAILECLVKGTNKGLKPQIILLSRCKSAVKIAA